MNYTGEYDDRARLNVLPVRIVKTFGNVVNAQALLEKRSAQAYLGKFDGCVLNKGGAVLLDFGEEFHGTLRITVNMIDGSVCTGEMLVRTGESVSEAMAEDGFKNAGNDHAVRNRRMRVSALSSAETNESGFRFAYVELTGGEKAEVVSVCGVEILRRLSYVGNFTCSDELLNRIWKVAARTTHVCMQNYLWDGIKRDRLVWMGDMHTEVMTILSVFGNQSVVTKSLDFMTAHTKPDEWMNGLPSYSLWWVIVNRDWFLYTGDRDYLEKQKAYLKALAQRLSTLVDENGSECIPGRKFLDWPTSENPVASHEGMQGILKMALDAAAEMLFELGEDETASACAAAAERMKNCVPVASGSKGAGAMVAMAGIADAKKTNAECIVPGGAKGYSSFMGGYIMEAKALAGDVRGALNDARDFWGGMLKMGATTFWEDFSVDWMENSAPLDDFTPEGKNDIHADFGAYCYKGLRHSLCHGWSSGPAWFFIKRVLGIRPLAPGFAKVEVAPDLGDLEYARGAIPTPQGTIRVSVSRREDGGQDVRVQAPMGIEVVKR